MQATREEIPEETRAEFKRITKEVNERHDRIERGLERVTIRNRNLREERDHLRGVLRRLVQDCWVLIRSSPPNKSLDELRDIMGEFLTYM